MKKKKHILNWIFSVFCLTCLPVYGITFGSIVLGLVGVLSLPINPIRNIWDMTLLHNGVVKVILFSVLFIFGASILPNNTVDDADDGTKSRSIEAYEDSTSESSTTEVTTTEVATTESTTEATTTEAATTESTTEAATTEVTTTEVTTTEAATAEVTTTETTTMETISTEVTTTETVTPQTTYVLNTNTGKFHETWCSSVDRMKDSNKAYHTGTRDEVIGMGYSPCGNCNP